MSDQDVIYFFLCILLGMIAGNAARRLAIRMCSAQKEQKATSIPPESWLFAQWSHRAWFRLLIPISTGALFWLACLVNRQGLADLILSWSLISFCLFVTLTDLYVLRIPNIILISSIPLFLLLTLINQPDLWVSHFLGGLVGILLLLAPVLINPEQVGMGDVKLLGVVGFALGIQELLLCVMLASVFAFVAALFVLVIKKGNLHFSLPFAPFLSAGAILTDFCDIGAASFFSFHSSIGITLVPAS